MIQLDLAPSEDTSNSRSASDLASRRVGAIVADDYRRARVMKEHGIEFCCGGGIPLEEACRRSGASLEDVVEALAQVEGDASAVISQATHWSNDLLMHYIEETHHGYVRKAIPSLQQFTQKVARVHGDTEPALRDIASTFQAMAIDMEAHMAYEEEVLFPAIRKDAERARELIGQAEAEHTAVGNAMHQLRVLSNDFTPPEWACATYRASFALLEEFEADLHAHVHLENNVLFPRMAQSVGSDA